MRVIGWWTLTLCIPLIDSSSLLSKTINADGTREFRIAKHIKHNTCLCQCRCVPENMDLFAKKPVMGAASSGTENADEKANMEGKKLQTSIRDELATVTVIEKSTVTASPPVTVTSQAEVQTTQTAAPEIVTSAFLTLSLTSKESTPTPAALTTAEQESGPSAPTLTAVVEVQKSKDELESTTLTDFATESLTTSANTATELNSVTTLTPGASTAATEATTETLVSGSIKEIETAFSTLETTSTSSTTAVAEDFEKSGTTTLSLNTTQTFPTTKITQETPSSETSSEPSEMQETDSSPIESFISDGENVQNMADRVLPVKSSTQGAKFEENGLSTMENSTPSTLTISTQQSKTGVDVTEVGILSSTTSKSASTYDSKTSEIASTTLWVDITDNEGKSTRTDSSTLLTSAFLYKSSSVPVEFSEDAWTTTAATVSRDETRQVSSNTALRTLTENITTEPAAVTSFVTATQTIAAEKTEVSFPFVTSELTSEAPIETTVTEPTLQPHVNGTTASTPSGEMPEIAPAASITSEIVTSTSSGIDTAAATSTELASAPSSLSAGTLTQPLEEHTEARTTLQSSSNVESEVVRKDEAIQKNEVKKSDRNNATETTLTAISTTAEPIGTEAINDSTSTPQGTTTEGENKLSGISVAVHVEPDTNAFSTSSFAITPRPGHKDLPERWKGLVQRLKKKLAELKAKKVELAAKMAATATSTAETTSASDSSTQTKTSNSIEFSLDASTSHSIAEQDQDETSGAVHGSTVDANTLTATSTVTPASGSTLSTAILAAASENEEDTPASEQGHNVAKETEELLTTLFVTSTASFSTSKNEQNKVTASEIAAKSTFTFTETATEPSISTSDAAASKSETNTVPSSSLATRNSPLPSVSPATETSPVNTISPDTGASPTITTPFAKETYPAATISSDTETSSMTTTSPATEALSVTTFSSDTETSPIPATSPITETSSVITNTLRVEDNNSKDIPDVSTTPAANTQVVEKETTPTETTPLTVTPAASIGTSERNEGITILAEGTTAGEDLFKIVVTDATSSEQTSHVETTTASQRYRHTTTQDVAITAPSFLTVSVERKEVELTTTTEIYNKIETSTLDENEKAVGGFVVADGSTSSEENPENEDKNTSQTSLTEADVTSSASPSEQKSVSFTLGQPPPERTDILFSMIKGIIGGVTSTTTTTTTSTASTKAPEQTTGSEASESTSTAAVDTTKVDSTLLAESGDFEKRIREERIRFEQAKHYHEEQRRLEEQRESDGDRILREELKRRSDEMKRKMEELRAAELEKQSQLEEQQREEQERLREIAEKNEREKFAELTSTDAPEVQTVTKKIRYRLRASQCAAINKFTRVFKITDPSSWIAKNCQFAKRYFPQASCPQIQSLIESCFALV